MSDEELNALDEKLASQIGDDATVIFFNHEYLFKQSRIAIADLRAQLASATYGRDVAEACNRGLVRLNEATQARADRAAADMEAAFRVAVEMCEKALRDWQDNLNVQRMPETAVSIGMAADVVGEISPPTDLAARVEEARK